MFTYKKAFGNGRKNVNLFTGISPYVLDNIKASIKKGKFIRKVTSDKGIVVEDSIVLSHFEIADLVKQVDSLQSFKWTEQINECLGFRLFSLMFDTVNTSIELDQPHQIVPPIYFRNGEYCFFYYDYHCGSLCGHGELQIIKVTQHGFEKWWSVFVWDS